jgi:hypothetical protein
MCIFGFLLFEMKCCGSDRRVLLGFRLVTVINMVMLLD